jgi:alkylation response protein AidB-like acyl-CoA dehydrogenase
VDFNLSPEQIEFQQKVRRLADECLAPGATERDERGAFSADVQRLLAAHGLYGMKAPREYGGLGLDTISYVLALQEIARVDAAIATSVAAHNSLCCGHLLRAGTEEQRRKYLPRLAAGECVGAWALTERGAGSDAGGLRTRAVLDGDQWVLNGEKMFITHGSIAGVYVILAVTDPEQGRHGITAFVVERGTPGLLPQPPLDKLGLRASDTAPIRLEECRIPAENQLGNRGAGFTDALSVLDGGRISIAAISLGLAQAALDASLSYARQREQFGQPIANFQAIQWMLADTVTEIAAAQLLTFQAAALRDAPGGRGVVELRSVNRRAEPTPPLPQPYSTAASLTRAASMAKLFASEMATRAALKALQIHGGYGYLRGLYPVERILRDAKFFEIGEGTSEIQRLVIARDLLKG